MKFFASNFFFFEMLDLDTNRDQLYQFMSSVLDVDLTILKSTVKQHAESHTIEVWKENLGDSFPEVDEALRID